MKEETRERLVIQGIKDPAPAIVDAVEEIINGMEKLDCIDDRDDAEDFTFQIITRKGKSSPEEIIAKIEDLMQPIK